MLLHLHVFVFALLRFLVYFFVCFVVLGTFLWGQLLFFNAEEFQMADMVRFCYSFRIVLHSIFGLFSPDFIVSSSLLSTLKTSHATNGGDIDRGGGGGYTLLLLFFLNTPSSSLFPTVAFVGVCVR